MQFRNAMLTFVAMGGFASPVVFSSPSSGEALPYDTTGQTIAAAPTSGDQKTVPTPQK